MRGKFFTAPAGPPTMSGTIAAVATSNAIAARGFTDLMLSSLDLAPKPPNGLARARRATPPPTTPSPWGPTSDSAHPRKPRLLSTMFGVTFRDSCLLAETALRAQSTPHGSRPWVRHR